MIIYDWKEQKGEKSTSGGINIDIKGFGDQLFFLCPIKNGWSVIGRTDKYLGPSTFSIVKSHKSELEIDMHEPGDLVLFCENGMPKSKQFKFVSIDSNFYKGTISKVTNVKTFKINFINE